MPVQRRCRYAGNPRRDDSSKLAPSRGGTRGHRFAEEARTDCEGFAENFNTDAEQGKTAPPDPEHPDYLHGLSAFDSLDNARDKWADVYEKARERAEAKGKPVVVRLGDHVAKVTLQPDEGFEIDAPPNTDPRGHLWIKGDKDRLAAAAGPIYPAARNST